MSKREGVSLPTEAITRRAAVFDPTPRPPLGGCESPSDGMGAPAGKALAPPTP